MGKKDISMNMKGHKVYLSVNFGLLASNNSSRDTGGGSTMYLFPTRDCFDILTILYLFHRTIFAVLSKGIVLSTHVNVQCIHWVMPCKVIKLLDSWQGKFGRHQNIDLWRFAPHCLFWFLWWEQNARCFEDSERLNGLSMI